MFLSVLGNFKAIGLLAGRLVIGGMFIFVHGYKKISGGPEVWAKLGKSMQYLGIDFLPVFWGFMGAASEFIGGILFAIGFFFRPATILLIATMFVAASFHLGKGDGLAGAAHAIELGAAFVAFLFVGPGRLSIDNKFVRG